MLRPYATLCLVLGLVVTTEAYDSAIKNKTLNQCNKYASTFLSYSEYSQMGDFVVSQIYAGNSWSTMKVAAVAKIASVSPSKSGQVIALGTKYIASNLLSGGASTITNALGVVGSNVEPFYDQLVGYIKKKKTNGMLETGCYNNVYRLASQWVTSNRVKLIMQRVKNKLGSKYTSFTASNAFGPLFLFGNYQLV